MNKLQALFAILLAGVNLTLMAPFAFADQPYVTAHGFQLAQADQNNQTPVQDQTPTNPTDQNQNPTDQTPTNSTTTTTVTNAPFFSSSTIMWIVIALLVIVVIVAVVAMSSRGKP